jgi:hypothetical protein
VRLRSPDNAASRPCRWKKEINAIRRLKDGTEKMLANAVLSTMINRGDEVAGCSHPLELRDQTPAGLTSLPTGTLLKTSLQSPSD